MSYDKDVEFMLEAYRWAEKFSTDPSTQNGAVLVSFDGWRDGQIVAWGANHFPQGVLESDERWQRPLKYSYVEHAERNAIFDAAARGVATAGLTMYVPWFACADCGRAIIQAGIREVVGHKLPILTDKNGSWDESIRIALGMLDEAGVHYRYLEGKLDPTDSITVRRNYETYHP